MAQNTSKSNTVEKALQQALVDLTDLALLGKQAHWNIQGSRFRALHLALDEIVDQVRDDSDEVAERLAAIGGTPDGRAATVSAQSGVKQFDAGVLSVDDVYEQFEEMLLGASDRIKATLDDVDEVDHLSNDLLIGVAAGLEKQAWMLRSATK
ncbi:MAG: DNA starvation/stationary phase protection protein [Actinomycetaceae bacterium]|jgi:starvation-inducible DNA-binding protein|nr:DNA starvation/stationary phase protection protein [Actinomycetaceae bacterium]